MNVLIVDDSIVFRSAIKSVLSSSTDVSSIDVASNGKIAVDKVKQGNFDAITLDLEMPVMDGTETIKEIRKFNTDIPIIIFSAQNLNAANKTLKALELGADDFVQKIQESTDVEENLNNIKEQLIPKFNALMSRRSKRVKNSSPVTNTPDQTLNPVSNPIPQPANGKITDIKSFQADLICIGSSTGGPELLGRIFSKVKKLKVPVLLIQHMPPVFTTQLAKSLNDKSGLEVYEAKIGDKLKPGVCYIAPGDYHMRLKVHEGSYMISLDQGEKVCFVRPAVDCTLKSVHEHFKGKVATFILTGMGNDGADGTKYLKQKDNLVIIQDEESSVVWGMPGAVNELNTFDDICNPDEIVNLINILGKVGG